MVMGWLRRIMACRSRLRSCCAICAGGRLRPGQWAAGHPARLPAFIATLAMMSVARGIASIITDGEQIVGLPGLVHQPRDRPPFRLLSVTVGVFMVLAARRLGLPALPRRRAQPLRDRRQPRGRAARRHPGARADRLGLRRVRRCSRASPASSFPPGSIRRSPARLGYELDTIAAVVIGGASLRAASAASAAR